MITVVSKCSKHLGIGDERCQQVDCLPSRTETLGSTFINWVCWRVWQSQLAILALRRQ